MLKNKDGTPYKLNKPNPLMQGQQLWQDYVVHNMEWEVEIHVDNKVYSNQIYSQEDVNFLEDLDRAKEEIPKIEKPKEILVQNNIEKTFIHCLPAYIQTKKDELYGETTQTIKYGNPTSFEGVLIEQNDLLMSLWTDVDDIGEESVLYPKTQFKRWWRVKQKRKQASGWILDSIPSDYQPSFTS